MHVCALKSLARLFATPWTVACQGPLSMGLSRQTYWSRLPCPPPGDLPDPGTEPTSLTSPLLAGGFFSTCATWEVHLGIMDSYCLLPLESNYACQKFQGTSRMPLAINIIFNITTEGTYKFLASIKKNH